MEDDRIQVNPKLVSLGTRIIALLWDYVIILGYLFMLFGVSFLVKPLLMRLFASSPLSAEITGFLLVTLPVYLYFAVSEGSRSRGTWGKRKMGMVVSGVHGRPITMGNSFFRSALKFAPWELAHFTIWHIFIPSDFPDVLIYSLLAVVYGLVLIYLISPIWSKKNQTLYDYIAGTVVRYKY